MYQPKRNILQNINDFSCTDDGNPPVGKSSRTNFSVSVIQVNREGSMPELPRNSVINKVRIFPVLTMKILQWENPQELIILCPLFR